MVLFCPEWNWVTLALPFAPFHLFSLPYVSKTGRKALRVSSSSGIKISRYFIEDPPEFGKLVLKGNQITLPYAHCASILRLRVKIELFHLNQTARTRQL